MYLRRWSHYYTNEYVKLLNLKYQLSVYWRCEDNTAIKQYIIFSFFMFVNINKILFFLRKLHVIRDHLIVFVVRADVMLYLTCKFSISSIMIWHFKCQYKFSICSIIKYQHKFRISSVMIWHFECQHPYLKSLWYINTVFHHNFGIYMKMHFL